MNKTYEYTIYTDLHIGAPTEIKEPLKFDDKTVFLGDNFDLKNTLKKNLSRVEELRKETIKNCRRKGGVFVHGNHSLEPISPGLIEVRDGVLFLHGDVVHTGPNKANRWRKKRKKGKSRLYWLFLMSYRKYFFGNMGIVRQKYIKNAYSLAKSYGCNTIIMGHFHPKNLVDINYQNIRIIIAPRGKSTINLNEQD